MAPLTPSQVQIIKSTVPILASHGTTITTKFYADMLAATPSLKNVFNTTHQATGHQPSALAHALHAYASHIDDLGALSPVLERICHKHVSLFIQPSQYAIVGTHLLASMSSVLGALATPAVLDAWGAAYWQLANLMISKEHDMYAASGWDSWRDYRISRKERESGEITSFYLVPCDEGMEVPVFRAGQYVSVNVRVGEGEGEGEGGMWQARQYSLSDTPGKGYLRISVKKERGAGGGEEECVLRKGYVSNVLHETKEEGDVLRLSHPFGDFYYEEKESGEEDPVVLISAGVGLTCLTSILKTLLEKESSRPVTWIHGARNSGARAFKKDVDALAANQANLQAVQFYSDPLEGEVLERDYDIKGRVDLEKVSKKALFTNNDKTQYYVCGPTQFMLDVEAKLKDYGVKAENVKMELFGTGGVPRV